MTCCEIFIFYLSVDIAYTLVLLCMAIYMYMMHYCIQDEEEAAGGAGGGAQEVGSN